MLEHFSLKNSLHALCAFYTIRIYSNIYQKHPQNPKVHFMLFLSNVHRKEQCVTLLLSVNSNHRVPSFIKYSQNDTFYRVRNSTCK